MSDRVLGYAIQVLWALWRYVIGWFAVDRSWVVGCAPSNEYMLFDSFMSLILKLGVSKRLDIARKRRMMHAFGHAIGTREGEVKEYGGVRCVEFLGLDRVIIQLHGGGYVAGSPEVFTGFSYALSRAIGATVISVDYTLCPEGSVHQAIEDVVAVYRTLLKKVSPSKMSFLGDSAGGGLVLLTLQRLKAMSVPLPSCAVLVSPWVDLTMATSRTSTVHDCILTASMLQEYTLQVPDKNEDVSPLFGSFTGLCPLYFIVGTHEILIEEVKLCHQNALAAGVDSKIWVARNMCHCFPVFNAEFPETGHAVGRISEYIADHC
eukprot:TRINITY_DN1199_c0_g1_i2.p2 TRINITY_DN1199_c0_g1~~TRINITY_DN1199_c0_g1_i2.p2  ORF type:complete len:319 (+),score=99.30 TRINITY_DN1199_c0_g1_i2:494-1450(+)